MKNKYLITLTPVGNYFFGGENSFGDKANDDKINYLVEGLKYPQQTTILGMLRYELLRSKGLLAPKHTTQEATYLIGKHGGFSGMKKDFGIIESISPVFIKPQNGDETSYILPEGFLYQKDKNNKLEERDILLQQNLEQGRASVLSAYDPKKYLEDKGELLIEKDNEQISVFGESQQVGIKKDYSGKTDNDSFFKQTFKRLNKSDKNEKFSFAFFACFSRELKDGELSNGIINMGADQSLFHMKIDKCIHDHDYLQEEHNTLIYSGCNIQCYYKIVFISDALVSKELLQSANVLLAITNTVSFQHLQSKADTKVFVLTEKMNDALRKSEKYELLSRGSVIYAEAPFLDELYGELVCVPNPIGILPADYDENTESNKLKYGFRQIGYNYFTITEIEKQYRII
ncbi:MAG: type III-B CRISPR module-associated Cmr3 family protein [Bacteroidales bacterium]|nr:type III-B CRISPR module-associated Cmr3 family protein [Bacteroidales bacterium]